MNPGDYVSARNPLIGIVSGVPPRDYGVVQEVDGDTVFVVFPIGEDDPRKHSQCAPYRLSELQAETSEVALRNLPDVWSQVNPMELIEAVH